MLPREFLSQIADKYELSPEQTDVFLEKFSSKKSDEAIAAGLHISLQAVSYRLGEVYKKFSFNGKGTGKAFQLLSFLTEEFVKTSASGSPRSDGSEDDLDELVQRVRSLYRDRNQRLYGTMRLWRVNDPVPVDRIYVDVNILDRPTRDFCSNIDGLWQDFNSTEKSLDRLGLGKVRQRIGGIKAVEDYFRRKTNVIVLGRPGSGKTTFLQYILIKCHEGRLPFLANLVPVFIRLRDFINDVKENSVGACRHTPLLGCIRQQLRRCSDEEIERLFEQGRMLILLDGLDEMPGEDSKAIVRQVEKLVRDYDQNRLILSCRTQAQEYRFNNFAEVEVADFDEEQVKEFAQKWFIASAPNSEQQAHSEAQARQFIEKLNLPENHQILDLAVTPILLSLTCAVFRDQNRFYSKPAELYEQGLRLLLKEWDESRGIERDDVYRNLTVSQKQKLLSYVAAVKFEQHQYVLFEQNEIQRYITDYLRTVISPSSPRKGGNMTATLIKDSGGEPCTTLQEDSEAVLKSIEAQHGLLVERAQRIYSFSHLTFQEYFTAKKFVNSSEPKILKQLVSHITDKRWSEVFLLAAGMPWNANSLMLLKQQIDILLASDEKLQRLLTWINEKSLSVQVRYEQAVVRAFYFAIVLNRTFDLNLDFDLSHTLDYTFPHDGVTPEVNSVVDLDLDLSLDLDLFLALDPPYALDRVFNRAINPELHHLLQQLKAQRPNPYAYAKTVKAWWKANIQSWTTQLRAVMIEHRNIGHDWQFNKQQKKLLQQYYDANLLLIDCLNSSCEVTDEVRSHIEDTLLLPIAEIEKRRQQS